MRTMVVVCTTEEEGRASLLRHRGEVPDDLWPPEESFEGYFLTVAELPHNEKLFDAVFVTHEAYYAYCEIASVIRKPDGWTYFA